MLSEDEKRHIRAEEEFRIAIREELSRKDESRVWKFLNSAFALWLLSAVFLSSVSAAWAHWRASRDDTVKRAAQIERIDIELATRLSPFEGFHIAGIAAGEIPVAPDLAKRTLFVPHEGFNGIAEFRERSTLSLLNELFSLLPPHSKKQQEVRSARDEVLALCFEYADKPLDPDSFAAFHSRMFKVASVRWTRIKDIERQIVRAVKEKTGKDIDLDDPATFPKPRPTRNAEQGGAANGSQPIRSETNRTSPAAGSRR